MLLPTLNQNHQLRVRDEWVAGVAGECEQCSGFPVSIQGSEEEGGGEGDFLPNNNQHPTKKVNEKIINKNYEFIA